MTKEVDHKRHTSLDSLFRYAEFLHFGEIHIKFDHATGLRAIIAVHNLKRGPAIGGCRLVHYSSADAAVEDAMRLAYGMSFKAAVSDLPHGGAKAVLMAPNVIKDRKALFESFAQFVDSLGGRYVTAIDSGTSMEDMDVISKCTPYVTTTTQWGELGNPSMHTARGVRRAIQAAVKFRLAKDSLDGIHVAIQGAGHVGYLLAKELHALGARLTMTDVNPLLVQRCVDEFGAVACSPDAIYAVKADVFSPCALGAILNTDTIHQLSVAMVVGSANNQLAHHKHAEMLHQRGILYAPDFVANAGGLIYAAAMYDHGALEIAQQHVDNIYENMLNIFAMASKQNGTTESVAEAVALERLR